MAHFSFERTVNAKPEEFYRWWSDFTPQDHSGPNWPTDMKAERTILEQDEGHAVIRDRFRRMELSSRVTKRPPNVMETEVSSRGVRSKGRSVLSAVPEGTKVQVDVDFMPQGFAKLLFPLIKGRVHRMLQDDLERHIKDFQDEKGMRG